MGPQLSKFNVKQVVSSQLLKNVSSLILVIAHPDDEVMFFAPTLLQMDFLLPNNVPIEVVCLSKGVDVDGSDAGETRASELKDSVALLLNSKRAGANRVVRVHQLDYQDGMDQIWDIEAIVQDLENILFVESSKSSGFKRILLSFDSHGVSNHPNHIACHEAVKSLFERYSNKIVAVFLNSHHSNGILKYSSFILGLIKCTINWINNDILKRTPLLPFSLDHTKYISLFNTYPQYILSFASMINSHQSQMVWFRYGWWSFSRFVYINDLEIMNA